MRKTMIVSVGCAALGLGSYSAIADYVGLTVILDFPGQMTAAGPRDVYRVYAEFTNPTDRVETWYGDGDHPFTIQNVLADGITLGSGFQNFGGSSGTLPPEAPGGPRDWDTWTTIGITNGDEGPDGVDHAAISMGFPVFIAGNSVTSSNSGVFVPTGDPQGRADWRIVGNDTNLRVLLMQLVVNVGEHVQGTINVDGDIGAPGSYESFTALDQTFASVPAPGGLAALAMAGIIGGRRWLPA